ncbi:MAG: hypothetical protein AAGB11_08030 [Pseudomonadota bacterium]
MEKNGCSSIATSPHVRGKTSILLHEGDCTKDAKLAVWFGNETNGISDTATERSRMCVAVPMSVWSRASALDPARALCSTRSQSKAASIRAS